MTPNELQAALDKVREHLVLVQYVLRLLTTSEPVELRNNYCPECRQKTLYVWCTPSIRWSKDLVEHQPQEILRQQRGFHDILDGQCYNPLGICGYSMWPWITRMDPTMLHRAPANALHQHGSNLPCPHCKKPTFWGTARDGKVIAGHCQSCKKPYLSGEPGHNRWRLFLALHRRQFSLLIEEGFLFRQLMVHKMNHPRDTIPGIGDPKDDDADD